MVSDGRAPEATASSSEAEAPFFGDAPSPHAASEAEIGEATNGSMPTETGPTDLGATDEADGDEADVDGTDGAIDNVGTPGLPFAVAMVFDIAVDLPAPHARVTLREVDGAHRLLVIPIGLPEATALAHVWRGVPTPRPLTHELFADVLTRLGATIDAVRLTGRTAGIVLAEIEISSPRGREVVPCRPTDAVTLAVRQGVPAPILVDRRLFKVEGDVEPRGAVTN